MTDAGSSYLPLPPSGATRVQAQFSYAPPAGVAAPAAVLFVLWGSGRDSGELYILARAVLDRGEGHPFSVELPDERLGVLCVDLEAIP
jgi:hypothetical protein